MDTRTAAEETPSGDERAAAETAAAEGHTTIRFTGRFWPLFKIWLGNLLLSVITLSFYRFWGRTRVRRYLWSNFEIDGDSLEYTGTGRELFLGFLILLAALVPFFFVQGLLNILLREQPAALQISVQWALYLILIYLGGYAYYRSRRYRLSRTLWRGIRPQLSGSPWHFANLAMIYLSVYALSLGLGRPWYDRALTRRLLTDIRIGSLSPTFRPRLGALFIIQAIATLIFLAAVALPFVIEAQFLAQTDDTDEIVRTLVSVFSIILLMIVPWLLLINMAYISKRYRLFAAGTALGNVTFSMTPGFWAVLRLTMGNLLLQLLLLGTGSAFTQYRTAKFYARHLKVNGKLDTAKMHQHEANETGFGDDIADVFSF